MSIFKRKSNINYKKTWDDISLKQFNQINDILQAYDKYTIFNLIDIIYGVDSTNLPLNEALQYNIDFLKSPINKPILKEHYIINGRKYSSNIKLTEVSAGQFLDFQNYSREKDPSFEKLLSVFFIPDGHVYNDGYNIQEVMDDLQDLPIPVVYEAAFFFKTQFQIFVNSFLRYFSKNLKKIPMKKDDRKIIMSLIKQVDLNNLDLFTGSGSSRQIQIFH